MFETRTSLTDGGSDGTDGGAERMVMHEFVHAIVRAAWQCYPKGGAIDTRMGRLLTEVLLPRSSHLLEADKAFEAEWLRSRRMYPRRVSKSHTRDQPPRHSLTHAASQPRDWPSRHSLIRGSAPWWWTARR